MNINIIKHIDDLKKRATELKREIDECWYGPEHEYGDNGRCVWCNERKDGR